MQVYDAHTPLLATSELLLGSLEAAREIGADLTGALAANGIQPELLVAPRGFLALDQIVNFLNRVAEESNCPHFGFLVGVHQPPMRFGLMAQLPTLSSTLGEAIENALQYNLLNSEFSIWELQRKNKHAILVRNNRISYKGSLTQLHTLAITVVFNAFRSLGAENWRPSAICFSHKEPETARLYNKYFGSPVEFNQDFTGIVFPAIDLQIPIATADNELLAIVKSHLDTVMADYQVHDILANRVQQHIRQHLGTDLCNLESVAQRLNQHPRTLQRELRRQGVTFRTLLTEVRHDVAEHYLRSSSIGLVDLADILGYRNVSAFSRAFKNTSGLSPEHWRRLNA